MPGITLENASPMANIGASTMKPASGPEIPMSNNTSLEWICERTRMNAPNVPIPGDGTKYGGLAFTPWNNAAR